ncbi:MAG: helix-turn-helix domain-containing protein [Fimbriimonas sp.]
MIKPTQPFDPSRVPQDEAERLQRLLESNVRPALVTEGGDVLELPTELNDFFLQILDAMRTREVIFLTHQDEAFTTQAAADFLGVSRQFLVRLLDEGKIPFHRVGSHRRIFFKDLLAYKEDRTRARRAKLDRMSDLVIEADTEADYVDLTRGEED